MVLLLILAVTLCALILAWVASMLYLNDFSVPLASLGAFKQVLVIFPHPDDETNVAGLVWQLRRRNTPVTLAVLTKGECGTPDAHLEPSLKSIRTHEMEHACQVLGRSKLVLADFGDGQVAARKAEVEQYTAKLLEELQPDLVIGYDLAGLYGHSDHIACAEVATELVRKHYPDTAVWYTTFPKRLLKSSHLPTHMAKNPEFASKRANANLRVAVGRGIFAKVACVYAHHSQVRSFRESLPIPLPLWFAHSMRIYEYYEKVQ